MRTIFFLFALSAMSGVNWEWFMGALSRSLTSMKVAASDMGISEAQLSRQVRGQEHMHVDRLEKLPLSFRQWYHLLAVQDLGLPEEVLRAEPVVAAVSGRKRMASMSESSVSQRGAA